MRMDFWEESENGHGVTATNITERHQCITQDHVFTIKAAIYNILNQRRRIFLAFLGLEKAFDVAPRYKISESFINRRVNSKFLITLKSLYKNNTNCIGAMNMKSDIFDTRNRLRQGWVMSPLLCKILMDDSLKQIAEKATNQATFNGI